jgi:hypothetical protein
MASTEGDAGRGTIVFVGPPALASGFRFGASETTSLATALSAQSDPSRLSPPDVKRAPQFEGRGYAGRQELTSYGFGAGSSDMTARVVPSGSLKNPIQSSVSPARWTTWGSLVNSTPRRANSAAAARADSVRK